MRVRLADEPAVRAGRRMERRITGSIVILAVLAAVTSGLAVATIPNCIDRCNAEWYPQFYLAAGVSWTGLAFAIIARPFLVRRAMRQAVRGREPESL